MLHLHIFTINIHKPYRKDSATFSRQLNAIFSNGGPILWDFSILNDYSEKCENLGFDQTWNKSYIFVASMKIDHDGYFRTKILL